MPINSSKYNFGIDDLQYDPDWYQNEFGSTKQGMGGIPQSGGAGVSDSFEQGVGLGSGLGDFLGVILGEIMATGDIEKANRLMGAIRSMYGEIDPEKISKIIAEQMGPTAMTGIQGRLDPRLRNAEMAALQRLIESGNAGGLDAQALNKIGQAQAGASQYERGQRGAIENRALSSGTFGSGEQYLGNLVAQQQGAQSAHLGGLQASADAESRALQSMLAGGNMAGSMRGADYGMESDEARAKDAVDNFNARMRHSANVYNANAENSIFNRQMQKAGAVDDTYYKEADWRREDAQQKRKVGQTMGKSAGSMIGPGLTGG